MMKQEPQIHQQHHHIYATILAQVFIISREGNGNPLQCSCLENPRDSGGAAPHRLKSMGSHRVRHDRSDLAAAAAAAAAAASLADILLIDVSVSALISLQDTVQHSE